MKFSLYPILWLFVCCATLLFTTNAQAAPVIIVDGTELFSAPGDAMGDYYAVAGNSSQSSPGQVEEVLGGTIGGGASLQNNGSESGTNTIAIGNLWSTLDAGGVTSTSSLVFGFGLNETGAVGSNYVNITSLIMSFELPDNTTKVFDLNGDTIQVWNYIQGQSTAEAKIQIDFGNFDFMTQYNASSTQQFTISATIDSTSDGFEIIFLSSEFTKDPIIDPTIPEPATLPLLALLGAGCLRRACRQA